MTPGADPIGLKTLELFSTANRFNRWLYESVAGYCRGNILEIGSGIGNISKLLLEKQASVTLSDLKSSYCTILQRRFKGISNLRDIIQVDLSLADFDKKHAALTGMFDTLIALNVIEHISDDITAIRNCKRLLRPGGRMIILVPAFQWLFNSLDKELGHFRRYNRKTLSRLLYGQGLDMIAIKYFNSAGIPGWWFSGSILKRKSVTDTQLAIYDKLVPLFRFSDKLSMQRAGLSVIGVGEVKSSG